MANAASDALDGRPSAGLHATRFAIVDPSIKSLAGHHLTYAVHVLAAAQQAGYSVVLATHRELEPAARDELQSQPGLRLMPIFRHQHWLDLNEFPAFRFAVGLGQMVRQFASSGATIRAWFRPKTRADHPVRTILLAICLVVPALLCLPFVIVNALIPSPFRPSRLLGLAGRSVVSWAAEFARKGMVSIKRQDFTADCRQFIRDAELSAGDIVFIPTLSLDELAGFGKLLETDEPAQRLVWHLLFRYDIDAEIAADVSGESPRGDSIRREFRDFTAGAANHAVHFWTDTRELAFQFNRLHAGSFGQLPIPHTTAIAAPAAQKSDFVTAVYLGDARAEKGYAHLPGLIRTLLDEYVDSGNLRFRLQSNVCNPEREPAVIAAKSELASFRSVVELIDQPLDAIRYGELLRSGDLVLLLYDYRIYAARSSGILAEALAAGKPVLVAAGTWLAEQLRPVIREYWQELIVTIAFRKTLASEKLANASSTARTLLRSARAALDPAAHALLFSGTPDFQTAGHSLLIHCRFEAVDGTTVQERIVWLGPIHSREAEFTLVMVPPDAAVAVLQWANLEPENALEFRNWRWEQIGWPGRARGDVPSSAVGVICGDVADAPACLAELVDHLPHYRRTAGEFAPRFFEFHNASRLVEILEQAGNRPSATTDDSESPTDFETDPTGLVLDRSEGNTL